MQLQCVSVRKLFLFQSGSLTGHVEGEEQLSVTVVAGDLSIALLGDLVSDAANQGNRD